MTIPSFGIVYGLMGIVGCLWGFRRGKPLQALGVVLLFVGAINAYSEDWGVLKHYDVALPLLVGFLGGYTLLSIRLMNQLGINKFRVAFTYSFFPIVYVLGASVGLSLPSIMKIGDNPPLTLYAFLLLILKLPHV
jgi:hypothetical protein